METQGLLLIYKKGVLYIMLMFICIVTIAVVCGLRIYMACNELNKFYDDSWED